MRARKPRRPVKPRKTATSTRRSPTPRRVAAPMSRRSRWRRTRSDTGRRSAPPIPVRMMRRTTSCPSRPSSSTRTPTRVSGSRRVLPRTSTSRTRRSKAGRYLPGPGGAAQPRSRPLDVAAGAGGLDYPFDSDQIGALAQGDPLLLRPYADVAIRLPHDPAQLVVHLPLSPPEVLEVLDPLEVGADDAARVRHHVGDHPDPLLHQDLVGGGSGGAVGALDDHLAVDPVGVALVNHPAEGRRDQDVAGDCEEVVGADHLRAGELDELAPMIEDVRAELHRVDPLVVADRPGSVRRTDHRRAELLHDSRRPRADVAVALHGEGCLRRGEPDLGGSLAEHVDAAPAGGLLATV